MAATAVLDESARRQFDRDSLAWTGVLAGAGLAVGGVASDTLALLAAGVALSGALVVVVAPELVLAVFLSAGILKANPALTGLPVDLTLLSAAGVAAGMLIRLLRNGVPPMPRVVVVIPALALLSLISVYWSNLPARGLEKALIFETFVAIAFFAPFVLVRSRTELIRFMIAIVIVGVFVASSAVETEVSSNPLVAAGGNQIELALAAGFAVLVGVGYLFVVGGPVVGPLAIIAATYLGTVILKAGSRGVLVGTTIGLLFLVVWLASVRGRARGLLLAVLIPLFLVALAAGPQLTGDATDKYREGLFSTNAAGVIRSRDYFLRAGWELTAANPFGTGSAGYEAATNEKYPHNIILEYGSELGIPGIALFVVLFVAAWRALTTRTMRGTPEAAVVGALLILFGIESLVSFGPNESRPLWFAMGFALALPYFRADR